MPSHKLAMAPNKLYALREIPGKGLGLVAATKIIKGTRILAEAPILLVPRSTYSREKTSKFLTEQVAALSDDKKQLFFSLHNAFQDKMAREMGIVRTNALPLGSDATTGGIFVESSRINHACAQNAQNTWNGDLGQLTIHAIRDIDQDEEITIMYLRERRNRADRQRVLQHLFRFTCSCSLCCLPPDQRGPSDARLDEIQRLDGLIGDGMRIISSPLQALHDVRKLLQLCEQEGFTDGDAPRAYNDAFQVAICNGDQARAKVFAERSCASRTILEGDDSPAVRNLRDLAASPTKHRLYGKSSQWSTSASQVPLDLSPEAFEAWLWRDQQLNKQTAKVQQYVNLRDDNIFPSFAALPGENDLDLEYFENKDSIYYPRKHWCFLAEIVEVENFVRLRLIVKDKAGRKVPVAFYTDGRGGELVDTSLVRQGHTVAILCPEQHFFLDMSVGIRHESPQLLKIFPVGLEELFIMIDKVQRYAMETSEGERICHGCDRMAASATLKKCARCSLFWYCDKTCQTLAWTEKGHKADCKLLSDADLRMLLLLGQGGFDKHRVFSSS